MSLSEFLLQKLCTKQRDVIGLLRDDRLCQTYKDVMQTLREVAAMHDVAGIADAPSISRVSHDKTTSTEPSCLYHAVTTAQTRTNSLEICYNSTACWYDQLYCVQLINMRYHKILLNKFVY